MNLAEAREFVALLESTVGHSHRDIPTASADQAVATLRDELRQLGIDTDDPKQMLGVFAGLLAASGSMVGYSVSAPVVFRMAHLLRAVSDWECVDGSGLPNLSEPPRRRRWWTRRAAA